MEYPTQLDLNNYLKDISARFLQSEGQEIPSHCARYALAVAVIGKFLGGGWLDCNLQEPEGDGYFKPVSDQSSTDDLFKHVERAVLVAEMLFNLKDVDGFEQKLKSLKLDDVESYVAEFHAAALLHGAGVAFGFRLPIGGLGKDYDLDIYLDDGTLAAGNTKCKVEATNLSEQTVRNALEDARKKLPTDRAGFVFMSIPENSAKNPGFEQAVRDGLDSVMRQTKRITTVFLWWEEWNTNGAIRVVRGLEVHNDRARFGPGQVTDLMRKSWDKEIPKAPWVKFKDMIWSDEEKLADEQMLQRLLIDHTGGHSD